MNALGLGLLVYMLVNGVLVSMTVALAEGVRLRWVLAQTLLSLPRDIVPMTPIIPWIALHHERPDGAGYPFGLTGDQIPLEARVIAVVDAFDAMIGGEAPNQRRPHKRSLSLDEALAELEQGAGKQFDSRVVAVFRQVVHEWRAHREARAGA